MTDPLGRFTLALGTRVRVIGLTRKQWASANNEVFAQVEKLLVGRVGIISATSSLSIRVRFPRDVEEMDPYGYIANDIYLQPADVALADLTITEEEDGPWDHNQWAS